MGFLNCERNKMWLRGKISWQCVFTLWFTRGLIMIHAGNKTILHGIHISNHEMLAFNVEFILTLLNNRNDILPDHRFQIHHSAVKSPDIGAVMKVFIDQLKNPPIKHFILGPAFSSESQVLADTAKHFNLLQIAYSSTSPALSDVDKYPLFTRTIESTSLNNFAMIKMLNEFSWTKVAKIVQDYAFTTESSIKMTPLLNKNNITVLASDSYVAESETQLKHIKASGAKIILAYSALIENVPRMFCRVYQQGIYGSQYQWLFWSARHGLMDQLNDEYVFNDNCTIAMVLEAMEGTISFLPVPTYTDAGRNQRGISGYTLAELDHMYKIYLNDSYLLDFLFAPAVDAVWTVALALNNSIERLAEINKTIMDFNYNTKDIPRIFLDEVLKLNYFGASGSISFDENGDRQNFVAVTQIQEGKNVMVGFYDPLADSFHRENGTDFKFKGGHPPADSYIIVPVKLYIANVFTKVFGACAVLGICYCIFCVGFTLKYIDTRLVKLSSPRINILIAVGCGLAYVTVILLGLESQGLRHQNPMCGIRIWVLVYSFTFSFGSMFSKIWRLHVIFTRKKLERKVVKDIHLFGMVAAVLAVDTVLLTTWQVVDPSQWEIIHVSQIYDEPEIGMISQTEVSVCRSNNRLVWSGFFYAFKALLMIFGIFFTWETRQIQIEALNDSKQIGISVYNVMILSLVSVPLINLLSVEQVDINYGVTSIAILISATTTLTLVFGLKVVNLFLSCIVVSQMYLLWSGNGRVDTSTRMPFAASLQSGRLASSPFPGTQPMRSSAEISLKPTTSRLG